MKLMILAPAVFPTAQMAYKRLHFFLLSCDRHKIMPNLYGIGTTQFPGYARMKVDLPLAYLESYSGFTHVLYTDSWDVLMMAGEDEIISKYQALGSPNLLQSAFYQLGNVSHPDRYPECFDTSVRNCYPNCGGFMGEYDAIVCGLRRMKESFPDYGDDCFMHYDAWQQGWWRPQLDSGCQIFQVRDEENTTLMARGKYLRAFNNLTRNMPCIWHFSGGSASQTTGRDEDMEPWARKLQLI